MNKYLISLIFLATQCFSQDVKVESIPDSTLKVSFPSNWNFFKSYNDDSKYGSIQLHSPDDKSGGFAASPEFEFHNEQSEDEMLIHLLESELSYKEIGGVESKLFKFNPEVSYLHSDMSHSDATLQITGYLVPINSGYLICKITTESGKEYEHKIHIRTLEAYCKSTIESAKAPNKALRQTNYK